MVADHLALIAALVAGKDVHSQAIQQSIADLSTIYMATRQHDLLNYLRTALYPLLGKTL